jgi:hypothetical protein
MMMIKINYQKVTLFIATILVVAGCSRDTEGLDLATGPTTAEVFIDGFSAGLNYAAFGGSDVTAFEVDTEVKYQGTSSMRISIPDFEDPKGAYAGGVYFTESGRDLSGYDALTFWAKSSQPANIDIVGIGNDLGENKFQASISGVPVNSNWRKFYIPIPDASKLTNERGMFFYSEGPEDDRGYTLWIDEVKFEKLGTIAHGSASIYDGDDVTIQAETGATITINGVAVFNLPNGVNQNVESASAYFTFESSDPTIASVDDEGNVMVLDEGSAIIVAKLGEIPAEGSLTIVSSGSPVMPLAPAPVPDKPAADVISLFSNVYQNEPVDFYNGYWEFSTTDSEIIQIDGDDVLRYTMLNFVGIQFTSPTINISNMTHIHLDIWTPNATNLPNSFKILLFDVGPDGSFDGNDNSSHELSFTSPTLMSETWVSLDIPLSDFVGLTSKSKLAQVVLSGDIPNVFMDNLYFYRGETTGGPTAPETAAPTPTKSASDVKSVFSDSYNNIPNTDFNPDWGQGNVVTQESIQGNNTLVYTNLDYQGVQFGSSQDVSDMEFIHLDYWTNNSSLFNVYLISTGPEETAFSMSVPTSGWGSVDIPLSDFTDVDLADVIQMKFDGNGTIYLDNIYFFKQGSGGGDEPTAAAPSPTLPATNVISLFSDSYTNVPVDTWRTDWSSATLDDVTIAGNATKRYSQLDFVGIETVANQIDVSGMTHFHIDAWSKDFTLFAVKLVDFGADGAFGGGDDVEHQVDFATPTQGSWIAYDIPLSDFAGLTTKSNIAQLILVGQPTGTNTVFIDNVYFHN